MQITNRSTQREPRGSKGGWDGSSQRKHAKAAKKGIQLSNNRPIHRPLPARGLTVREASARRELQGGSPGAQFKNLHVRNTGVDLGLGRVKSLGVIAGKN